MTTLWEAPYTGGEPAKFNIKLLIAGAFVDPMFLLGDNQVLSTTECPWLCFDGSQKLVAWDGTEDLVEAIL